MGYRREKRIKDKRNGKGRRVVINGKRACITAIPEVHPSAMPMPDNFYSMF